MRCADCQGRVYLARNLNVGIAVALLIDQLGVSAVEGSFGR